MSKWEAFNGVTIEVKSHLNLIFEAVREILNDQENFTFQATLGSKCT